MRQYDITVTATKAVDSVIAFIIANKNEFIKSNVGTMVGDLYSRENKRRDGGFSIFYMGINIGAFTAHFSDCCITTRSKRPFISNKLPSL